MGGVHVARFSLFTCHIMYWQLSLCLKHKEQQFRETTFTNTHSGMILARVSFLWCFIQANFALETCHGPVWA